MKKTRDIIFSAAVKWAELPERRRHDLDFYEVIDGAIAHLVERAEKAERQLAKALDPTVDPAAKEPC